MAAEREPPTVADYVVTALSPVLVMLMVGSLVFFLVEVLYAGKYSDRLLYTFFFFVAATVLVARISIQAEAGRAAIYGIALAVVTYIALLSYVEYPPGWLRSWGWLVNFGLMAVVWWSAHKLTWDCTHIDEKRESSGRGLLNAAGLDADSEGAGDRGQRAEEERKPKAEDKKGKKRKKKRKGAEHDSRLWAWIERYKSHREAERKAGHTPGVWVLYFALAALPLFALGQSLISPDDEARRRATFIQMAVYIASALGLLVTTSLLGVRRYLRQRKARIPAAMTASWLGLGAVTILAFLALGAFLPRPHSEVPWFGIERAGKEKRQASQYARSGGSTGEGDGAGGSKTTTGAGNASGKGGAPGGSKGDKGGGKGDGGKGGSGKKGDQSGGNEKGGGKGKGDESDAQKDEDGERKGGGADAEREPANEQGGARSGGTESSTQLGGALAKVANAVKWLVFGILAILIVFGLFFALLKYLAPFTDWARRWLEGIRAWWASLFGSNPGRKLVGVEEAKPQGPVRPPPFTDYSNPFADGTADGRDPAELIAYTFEALDAWAWDRDAGRDPAETPLEFARRLGEEFGPLAALYTRSAYSDLPPPDTALATLEEAWERMVHGVAAGA